MRPRTCSNATFSQEPFTTIRIDGLVARLAPAKAGRKHIMSSGELTSRIGGGGPRWHG